MFLVILGYYEVLNTKAKLTWAAKDLQQVSIRM